jgi:hypothetical protein
MRLLRFVALLPWIAAAGCYSEAPAQSTLPDPTYVSGPPGGAMDPGGAYGQSTSGNPAYNAGTDLPPGSMPGPQGAPPSPDDDDDEPVAVAPAPAAPVPPVADPGASGTSGSPGASDEANEDVADATPTPGAPADPTAGVTDIEIDATLDGYGQWVETEDYGQVWRPDATVVGVDFTPYESGGSWQDTDAGWAFACDYHWGWLPFHYGRWAWFHDYWGWVPGHRWGPAWVEWRHGGGVVGWRPIAPGVRDHRHGYQYGGGATVIRDHRHAEQHDAHWRFATANDFGRPHIRSHLYGNLAEGLRVTSRVPAPPLRARTTVRATDLMTGRFATGGRALGAGRFGGPTQVRDHRSPGFGSSGQVQTYQPAPGGRPWRSPPYNAPARTYQPPVRDNPAVRGEPPARGYYPPARGYNPPARGYNPPARTYQPPARVNAPARSGGPPIHYNPPARTFSPSSPPSHPSSSGSSHPSGSSHSSSSSGSSSHSSGGGSHHR